MGFGSWCVLHASCACERWNALEQVILRRRFAAEARADAIRRYEQLEAILIPR
jgi:hypothetical protein